MDLTLGKRLRELPGPVMVTGHTGFKGTWLTLLLERLGISVVGLSLPPEPNSLFARANRIGGIPELMGDIRDFETVKNFVLKHNPTSIIHMAAQPLVLESYRAPRETFETNVMGTVNLLDSAFQANSVEVAVIVTTDKVYRNDNSGRLFIESDALAGKDPYSASKVGTEAAVAAWQQISKISGGPRVVSVRAGNVIGGGDWAENRLIPDLIRGFFSDETVKIRNPENTRPWQHVLDPLIGYLLTLEATLSGQELTSINFGPEEESLSVSSVVDIARRTWPFDTTVEFVESKSEFSVEAERLQLDSQKARESLNWQPTWSQSDAVAATVNWWEKVLFEKTEPSSACADDIDVLLRQQLSHRV